MKKAHIISYQPQIENQKIWRVCPDPKNNFAALEVRKSNATQNSWIEILDIKKGELVATKEIKPSQTLLNFYKKIVLLSELDLQSEMPLAKGIQAFLVSSNGDFELLWELEEVNYYGIIEKEDQSKVVFSLESHYYSVPIKPPQNMQEIEAQEENYANLSLKEYFKTTQEYSIQHIHYKAVQDFIFQRTQQKSEGSIGYTENESCLVCSYLYQNQNYLLCTDRKGNTLFHFSLENNIINELVLCQNTIFWLRGNELEFVEL